MPQTAYKHGKGWSGNRLPAQSARSFWPACLEPRLSCLVLQANALFGILGFGGGMDFDSDKAYRCSGCFFRKWWFYFECTCTLVPPEGEQPLEEAFQHFLKDLMGQLCNVFKLAGSDFDPPPLLASLKQCFCLCPAEMSLTSVPAMMAVWRWLTC